jgi:glycerol-3-phosphate O-acyltransferase / dihydroxyacetone phosphate acyltransferase
MQINPFLRVLYHFFRILAYIGARVYFRRLAVLGKENLGHVGGPIIIVANHPSTLMDVLLPGAYIPRVMFFLANYGLFKNPVSGWIFRRLYCIPVKRKEDVEDGEQRDNDDAFEMSFEHLTKGGALFIAPEGVSYMNRYVRPLKTGTARIGLGAEARNAGNLGLKILPIGLSYNTPHLFRSNAVMRFGTPIKVADWLPAWRENGPAAVDQLTEHIENQLKILSIHTDDDDGEIFTTRLEAMLHTTYPLPLAAEYERTQEHLQKDLNNSNLREKMEQYFAALQVKNIDDNVVAGQFTATQGLILLLGWPLLLPAFLFWLLPCYLPYLLNKKLNLYIGYSSTVKVVAGLFFVMPLMLWIVWHFGQPFFSSFWHYPAALTGFLLSGLFAEYYLNCLQAMQTWQKRKLLPTTDLLDLQKVRATIIG